MGCSPGIVSFGKVLKTYLSERPFENAWWTCGGCWTLAQALHEYLGDDRTELWAIGSPFGGSAYHVVVMVGDCFLDAKGASTREEIMKVWQKKFPNQYLIIRKLSEKEKQVLFCDEPAGPSVEEMVDRMTKEFGACEILWRRFFS